MLKADSGLATRYRAVRQHTLELAAPLSDEDCCVQSMPDASPVKWHMAHTTWFFETFILERHERDFRPFHPAFRVLFNSYYNGIGDKHPRPQRGMITRPGRGDVLAYRRNVDERMLALLADAGGDVAALVETGLQHEQQHQELILTDLKHMLSMNPLAPAYRAEPPAQHALHGDMAWQSFEGGVVEIGYPDSGFCFDNETPRHRQFLEPFSLATRLVTNGDFLRFIEDGGYRNPALWLSEGWDWVNANRIAHPLYWHGDGPDWQEFTLHGMQPLAPQRPAVHLSYFEADAYARWAGARLPTEAEWEHAALASMQGSETGLAELFDVAWQWTSSSYAPYPGYAPLQGALGEYNGKFMVNQYVLRGSSSATPAGHSRVTYRNFFPATARWQFTGLRLARSAAAAR
ncbi:ergothioneine biosynthesis protein EgtB [Oxalobacteraceae bacterium OM1]|nr:ergothioneine biosynthesis protein EgtB [Oxalobacteraceae bacterium OM1]